ncbi:MAG: hypothetical protein LBJ00_08210 [Planctomycetaceae bacterium]|jgi:hypothetical protein|nr:hypothetical protein [Planctomycetaceae bacterium]
MSRKLNFAKKYQIEWELPQTEISQEEWKKVIELSEDEEEKFGDEIWQVEYEDYYEVPKPLLEKRIKQYKLVNKRLSDFCEELLQKSDKDNDYVRVEIF